MDGNYPEGTEAYLTCISGYTPSGVDTTSCLHSGSWKDQTMLLSCTGTEITSQICNRSRCPVNVSEKNSIYTGTCTARDVLNARTSYSKPPGNGMYPVGTIISADCNNGYIHRGGTSECLSSESWTGHRLYCEQGKEIFSCTN